MRRGCSAAQKNDVASTKTTTSDKPTARIQNATIDGFFFATSRACSCISWRCFLRACSWCCRFALDVYLRRAARRVRVPVLLVLAEHDRIIDNRKTRAFAAKFDAVTTILDYPEAHHTLEFEPSPDFFIDDLIRWLNTRVDG